MRNTKGQVLVWVAVLLVALMILAGLALDAGTGLMVRREMQNAADAGALAGAHALCLGDRSAAAALAADYAARNGAAAPVAVEIRDAAGNIDAVNGSVVWVQAGTELETTLLGLAGIQSYAVSASASAGCGDAESTCGLWPIAFPQSVWEDTPCGTSIYIWDGDKVSYDCEEWDCVVDGDEGGRVIAPGERGWLEMSASFDAAYPGTCPGGGGAALVKALIEDDCAGRISLPACIPGETGVKASVEHYVDNRAGDLVIMPLFDSIGCNGSDYHIADFGCVQVVAYHKGLTINVWDPDEDEWHSETNTKAIEVIKSCQNCLARCGGFMPSAMATGGGDVIIVGLTE